MSMAGELRRIFLEACVLIAFGALIGLSFNHDLVLDAFSGRMMPGSRLATHSSGEVRAPRPVLLEEVRRLMAQGALPVDARNPESFAEGHLPSAISLPLVELAAHLDSFRRTVSTDHTLVVYCSGYGCPDSFDLAVHLAELGYRDVRIFEGGVPEWRAAGYAIEDEQP